MKKKILALCLVVVLVATAITGVTLAYFTDTDTATNTFTIGDVKIDLKENFPDNELMPGDKTHNNLVKEVWVENVGSNDAYMWIEVWIPASLDDGDDHSPSAPGLGNNLHFNYGADVTETKATFLGSKDGYNGYVHYVKNDTAKKSGEKTINLLDQVYMDKAVTQCETEGHAENCMVLMDGTHYTGSWELVINAIGFQAEGFDIHSAIEQYYGKDLDAHLW